VDQFNYGTEYSRLLLGDAPALEREVSRLDEQWQVERKKHFVSYGEDSTPEPPSASGTVGSIVVGVVVVAFGVFWIAEVSARGAPGFSPLFGMVIFIVGIGFPIYHGYKFSVYRRASEEYERRREELVAQMNDVDGPQ
jgi:hypothetical protein